ncbi:hypothetical protein FNJ88_11190 [Chryseobacterium sp. SNU WT5]|uniref:hypothetical protein n=1 Tax=Chryseobacterium sp. SNU WT5 TaxID=2594269 RepID=UPI00117FD7AE|nr:hypothetical protein [Chryseobacterium sp. SNU WT5]QDP86084.1 hypothetical protein FNJ88_11190 [Chryseobacterium sp. SNU WT5]
MSILDYIFSKLPDNSSKKITAKDVRDSFEKTDERINQVISGIKGNATQANAPTPWTSGDDDLFESYRVVEPIDVTSTWYTLADATNKLKFPITQTILDANNVLFNVKNGVVSVFLSLKNNELADGQVTTEKTDFAISDTFPAGANILNPAKIITKKRPHPVTGLPFDTGDFDGIFYIRVKSNQPYSFKGLYDVAWFDEDKNLISNGFSSMNVTSPVGSAYLSVSYGTGETGQIVKEGTFNPVEYEPFVGVLGTKIKSLIFDLLLKDGNKLNIGNTTTNEIRLQGIRQYYQDIPQGTYYGGGAGGATVASVASNTAWGRDALASVTTGGVNTAFGSNALKKLKTGFDNTAFGAGALENFEDGVGNNAFGRLALSKLVNGGHNTGLTDSALEKLEVGDDNTCIGYGSGTRIIQGYRNTLYGVYASGWYQGASATQQTNYDDTCAFGAQTLTYNISGSKNNVFGNYAMHQLTGEKNCAFGYYSMYNSTNSNNNACFGNNSGGRLVNGNGNVFIGDGSGFILGQKVDASGTTVIGKDAISTRNNEVVIGKNTDTHVTICGVEFTRAQILALKALV